MQLSRIASLSFPGRDLPVGGLTVQEKPRRVRRIFHEGVAHMSISKRAAAEFIGTFWLVLGGCGSAVLAGAVPLGIAFAGVSLAFGLTVLTGVYALGHISGGHFNPAVSVGLLVAKRFPAKDLVPYVLAQVVGAVAASTVLYLIASGRPGFELGRFA